MKINQSKGGSSQVTQRVVNMDHRTTRQQWRLKSIKGDVPNYVIFQVKWTRNKNERDFKLYYLFLAAI